MAEKVPFSPDSHERVTGGHCPFCKEQPFLHGVRPPGQVAALLVHKEKAPPPPTEAQRALGNMDEGAPEMDLSSED